MASEKDSTVTTRYGANVKVSIFSHLRKAAVEMPSAQSLAGGVTRLRLRLRIRFHGSKLNYPGA